MKENQDIENKELSNIDNIIVMNPLNNSNQQSNQVEEGEIGVDEILVQVERPVIKTSIFNIPTVGWITPLLFKGAKSPLQQFDLYDLPDLFKANYVADYLNPFWDAIQWRKNSNGKNDKAGSSLFSIVVKRFGKTIFATILFQGLSVACILTIPTFLQQILYSLTPPTIVPGIGITFDPKSKLFIQSGVVLSIVLTLLQIGSVFFQNTSAQLGNALQVDFKTMLIGAVYEKSLKLSQSSSRKYTQGQILNTINVDVEKVSAMFLQLASLTAAPIQVAVSLILLSDLIGIAVWGGFGVIFGILTLQILVIGFLAGYQKSFLQGGDKRLKLLREVLYGIKIIKFRALESFFATKISDIRAEQLSVLKKYYAVQAYFVGLIQIAPIAMPIVGFLIYAAINGDITPAIIFPALSLFQGLFQPILTIPQSLTATIVAIVSWRRINDILEAEEGEDVDGTVYETDELGSLVVENLELQWESVQKNEIASSPKVVPPNKKSWFSKKSSKETSKENIEEKNSNLKENDTNQQGAIPFKLSSISLSIKPGSKVAIVGPVGCGKSSLLSGLIKEMPKLGGHVSMKGRVAYCNQQPWILTDTIEGNITFNQPYNKQKLDKVLAVCGLDKDLQLFPAGVKTEIGEKGVNLSGGQKARVALARALYFSPDLLLLDDPISALDSQVGAFVFEKAIKEYASSKTVLLVTHQLHLLPETDWVVVMDRGRISQQGPYKDLIGDKSGTLAIMMKDYKLDEAVDGGKNLKSPAKANQIYDENEKQISSSKGGIIVEEERKAGSVSYSVFWHYFQRCGGSTFVVIVIFSALLNAGTQVMTNLWLSWWTSNKYNLGQTWYMRGYGILGLVQFAFALMINTIFLSGCYKAAKYYHPTALSSLFNAPMGYFDSQPIGRLLNRMSKDIESIDQNLWILMFLSTIAISGAFASLCFLCYVDQRMIALAIPLVVLYYFILKYYQRSNIEFKRFESNNRSPLYAHVSETLAGISTVKAYAVERDFVRKQRRLMDESNIPTFLRLMASVWVNMRLGVLSSLLTLLLCLLGTGSAIEPSLIGVSLTYAIGFAGQLGLLLFASSQLENEFNSVERLKVFCEDLPKEASKRLEADPSPSQWPTNGVITFDNVSLSYPSRPDVLILKNLKFEVKAGEKVGIIGRTGSGKSTIMTALFRLIELINGSIYIDEKDISKIGLATLRKAIQIIPQEPVLFTGTIRENLDMEGLYPDEAVWEVLDRIGMKEYVESLGEEKLSAPVTENGENLSVGQRQLVCLGRAILMKPRILVMDEATASVDGEADKLIQKSIKTYFADTTVLSIAHRLNTIADFDRVLVLQEGEMIEFDSPHELLSREDSLFSQLAEATGVANAALLRQIALEKHNSLHK